MTAPSIHTSVLPAEVMSFLAVKPGMRVVDGTLGGGGHTRLLAEAVGPTGLVIAVDRDPEAIARGARELAGLPVRFAQANYCDIPEVLDALAIEKVDGVLLDVGLSSDQLADESRGFSFESEGPLDLRFDPTEGEPAWRIVNRMRPESLADIIHEFGEERFSRRIARRIAAVREIGHRADLARLPRVGAGDADHRLVLELGHHLDRQLSAQHDRDVDHAAADLVADGRRVAPAAREVDAHGHRGPHRLVVQDRGRARLGRQLEVREDRAADRIERRGAKL